MYMYVYMCQLYTTYIRLVSLKIHNIYHLLSSLQGETVTDKAAVVAGVEAVPPCRQDEGLQRRVPRHPLITHSVK